MFNGRELEELQFSHYDENSGNSIYVCPLCGGQVKVSESVFYGRCDTCLATVMTYKPAPHQINFHESKAKYRLNIGGYGSGKTTMGAAEISNHALKVSNGRTLITAQSLQQVKEAVLPELEKFLPPWFLKKKVKNPLPKYVLTNGHEIIVYASNDEEKIRSLNLTAFWIIEASGVDYTIFTQLQTRLRNRAAIVKDKDGSEIEHNFIGIVESNPEEGWIRDEMLLRSGKIFASKSVDTSAYDKLRTKKPEKSYHSFLSATPDNTYLHSSFIEDTCVGKSERWIKKYIYCFLETKEGVVYPEYIESLVDPFPIPEKWKRIYGFDKGWTDETCLVCIAIDPKGVAYVYDEYYQSQKPMTFHAIRIKEMTRGFPMYKSIQADPSVRNKNERDGQTYRDYFMKVSGVWLEEANNSILDGIDTVKDMMYTGKLKFFTNCINLREEAQDYCWKIDKKDGMQKDVPVDKRNHLMDALRYAIMALPFNLMECYNSNEFDEKESILGKINETNEELLKSILENGTVDYGGAYGLGAYNL